MKPTELPWQRQRREREELIKWHRGELPGNGADEIDELIEAYGLSIQTYHKAALKGDENAMADASARAAACVANYWGTSLGSRYDGPRELFSCWVDAAVSLAKQVEAPEGQVPMYGQRGRFVLTIKGCRVDFHYDGIFGICGGGAYVIDLDRPFISETGFRSFQVVPHNDAILCTGGLPVEEYFGRVCEAQLQGASLVNVDRTPMRKDDPLTRHEWLRQHRTQDPAWWPEGFLAQLTRNPAYAVKQERSGQLAMIF